MATHRSLSILKHPVSLWVASVLLTLACFTWQDQTGPTYPLSGAVETDHGTVTFVFARSETIGNGLPVVLTGAVPEGIRAEVRFRRFRSHDSLRTLPLQPGVFELSRRGSSETVRGLGATLPSLAERAGKYEYRVFIDDGSGAPWPVTGETPVYARYKAHVPVGALLPHILVIFISMTFAIRTTLEAIVDGNFRWMLWATLGSLLLGAFVLGPWVQWYAFGVWWSGIPFGYDWTDNKVLIELAFWIAAIWMNRGGRRHRGIVIWSGVITVAIYFIPHSLFGSEFDYRTGTGHGTAG